MKKIALLIVSFALFLSSCDDSATNVEAELTNYETIILQPGFQWIPLRKEQYEPVSDVIDSIKKYYKPDIFSFYIFAKPSCTCEGAHNQIAFLFDIFDEADIDYSNSMIYAMNSINNIHPYQDILTINELPAFYVLKNNNITYSLRDTLNKRIENSQEAVLEKVLLDALKGE
jgi:hypothetical protein